MPPQVNLPSTAASQAAFLYRVVCDDGAYVRAGLELSSRHLYTVGSQSLVEITERCVNAQGLARLRTADGWISEMLNPLSGQRGPIVEQLPLEQPLKFRIVFPGGALVRSGVELSSSVVGTIPAGQEIVVTEKRFSNTPSYRCVPRLKLGDGSGWISLRINSPPPNDTPVVELLGLAEEGDVYYTTALLGPPMVHGAGMIEGGESGSATDGDESPGAASTATHAHAHAHGSPGQDHASNHNRRPTTLIFPSEKHGHPRVGGGHGCGGGQGGGGQDQTDKIIQALMPGSEVDSSTQALTQQQQRKKKEDHSCLICFSSHRNATFVHGETGHIACCLECARVLKGRGDPCPVCRLPVDTVIQHFWA
jgi:hypothetical protein